MGRPKTPIPSFEESKPWGAYRPSSGMRTLLSIAHALPRALSPLTKILRRPIKYQCEEPLDITIWDLMLRLLPRGNLSEQKLYTSPRNFDPEEFELLARTLKPSGVFIDIGANAGIYSFWAYKCMGSSGRIIAVEPDPMMRTRMGFNIRTNSISNIEICPVALSDHEGSAELQINPEQRGQNTLDPEEAMRAGGARTMMTVPVTTLSALLSSLHINNIDILKIDIEGHEPAVLRHFLNNAPESLWPKAIIIEFKNKTASDILSMLVQRGYKQRKITKLNFIFERG